MRGRRVWVGIAGLTVACALWAQAPEPPPVRFADVNIRLFTTGTRQPTETIGAFTSSLPLGKTGRLHRLVTITNETRNVALSLEVHLSLTPTLDEAGTLHCVVLSESTPKGGEVRTRARDLTFQHPGEQVMEIYADPVLQTRVMLAVDTHLAPLSVHAPASTFPLLIFTVKVEQWSGAEREEIEHLQLQSLDGKEVSHEYRRRVPRWVSADSAEGTATSEAVKTLDFSQGTPTVRAGEGFAIPAEPKGKGKKGEEGEGAAAQPPQPPQPPSALRLAWIQEFCNLALEPVAFEGNYLRLRVSVSGQFLDRITKQLLPPFQLSVEKTLLAEQPVPFYLTREAVDGPQGYVVWVVPSWSRPAPRPAAPAEDGPAPAAAAP
jgi:hypothetical protein